MNSNIEVPKPRVIDRSQLSYSATIKVPKPALIDRAQVIYGGNPDTSVVVPKAAVVDRNRLKYAEVASKVVVPTPAKIDRSKLSYDDQSIGRDIPMPAVIDRSQLVYAVTPGEIPKARPIDRAKLVYIGAPILVPQPAAIDRSQLTYTLPAGVVPKARGIDRSKLSYLEPQMSVLEKNVHSPITPGAKNFPKFAVTPELDAKADQRIAQYPADEIRSAVLPLLHEVQHKFGFISPESIDWVATKLGIEPMKVVEVVTFYPGFRQKAPGKLHVRVCRTLSCAMGGSYELMEKLCEITQIDRSKEDDHKDTISVSPCGNFSVEYAECLASCGTAPVCLVNDDFHEGVTAEKAAALLDSYQNA